MRILFVTSNRIGDAVLSTGLIDHLLRAYPTARFTIACGPVAEGLFTHMPRLERLIVMEKRRYGRHWLPLWGAAVSQVWDLVVDIRASAISYLVATKRRAVMRKSVGHKTEQLARLLRLSPAPLPVVWHSAQDRALAERLLPEGGPLIGLGPTANWTGKVWPPERFSELFQALTAGALPGARPVIFAGPGAQEAALAAPLLAALPDAIDLSGKLELSQAAACLARCALFIGNDSGLMHLAAAAGAPTLGLFGPTPSAEYGPSGPRALAAVSPSARMEDLSVDTALDVSLRLLALG
jgi:ADP-heptose:LPS heptosyltransferase